MFLPETYKSDLPDSLADAEKIGQPVTNIEYGELKVLNGKNNNDEEERDET